VRIAALYDIHGNSVALEAVLAEVGALGVDRVVMGGDLVPGPEPREVIASLLGLNVPVDFIYGNGEVAVLEELAGRAAKVPEQVRPMVRWSGEQLGVGERQLIQGWPKTLEMEISGVGTVIFCHATPRDENEIFTKLTAAEELRGIFEGLEAEVVVCGHTHMQFDLKVGDVRVVNAGSVGMPFGAAGADWLLLGDGAGSTGVELRHTNYNLESAAERIRATSFPGAAHFAESSVLHPPSEEQMLKAFTKK
jgi:predicted phosphodiesterase